MPMSDRRCGRRLWFLAVVAMLQASPVAATRTHPLELTLPVFSIEVSKKVRGVAPPPPQPQQYRRRTPKRSSGGGSGYLGCLGQSTESLQSSWLFPGEAPSCSYVHHGGNGGGGSGSGSGGGSSGSGGGSSGGGGSGGGSSSDDDDSGGVNGNGDDDIDQDVSNEDFDDDGGGDDDGGNGGGGDDDGDDVGDDGEEDDDGNNGDGGDGDDAAGDDDGNVGDDGGADAAGDDGVEAQSYDPYEDFNIEMCDTYENLWLWDLSFSCESADELGNCECTFAEELMDLGMLSCEDAALCPGDCPICTTCLRMLGCPVGVVTITAGSGLYVFATAIGILLMATCYYLSLKRNRGRGGTTPMGAHLLEAPASPSTAEAVPTGGAGVWLAPDTSGSSRGGTPATGTNINPHVAVPTTPVQDASSLASGVVQSDSDVWLAPLA